MTNNQKLEAALRYASWGWHVLPLQPNSKIPATAHGVHDATVDPEQIRKWWTRDPEMNIGVAAGRVSNLVVFDVDPRNGGDQGWEEWTSANGPCPDGAMQLTAGGGYHHLGQYTDKMRSCKLATGVDLLSDGRYFVVHPSTIDGRSYEWEGSSDPAEGVGPFPVPQAWLNAYQGNRQDVGQRIASSIIKGSRNDALLSYGGMMRHGGATESEILAALTVVNEQRCDPPLPDSEVRHVARSVSRYNPETDVAQATALGADAAKALLHQEPENDWMLPADAIRQQPACPGWNIDPWLPEQGLAMVHGPSGAGKSFLVLDWCLHIATNMKLWNKGDVEDGPVVYLAGEGHYGLRARIQGWMSHHRQESCELFVSAHGVDINTAAGFKRVVDTLQSMGIRPRMIVIDTLHRHMAGDENSAQDTKGMIEAMARLQELFGCLVLIVHHTGNSEDTQHRARGSSAWRAAMDIEISVVPGKRDKPATVTMRKAKDSEAAEPVFFRLSQVTVPEWYDRKGRPVTTAIVTITEGAAEGGEDNKEYKNGNKHAAFIKYFERAWFEYGCKTVDDLPWVGKKEMFEMLKKENSNRSDRTIENDLNPAPSYNNKLVGFLVNAGSIKAASLDGEHGWVVVNEVEVSSWQIRVGQ